MTNGFDRLLRDSLRRQTPANGNRDCLDGELLAAWFDGTLPPAERTAVEIHAAACSRCQAMMAALVRTDRPLPRVWWQAPAVRWLVPLALAAASLLIWIRVPPQEEVSQMMPAAAEPSRGTVPGAPSAAPTASSATASSPVPEQTEPRSAAAELVPPPARTVTARDQARSGSASGRVADSQLVQPRVAVPAASPPGAALNDRAATAAPLPQVAEMPPASAASVPPQVPRAGAAGATAAATSQVSQIESETRAGAAGQVAGRPRAETMAMNVAGKGAGRGGAPIVTPDLLVRWRIAAAGKVERSADAGATWQAHAVDPNVILSAGAAPSANVCWLVGWRGVVLKTLDAGQSWIRVSFPEAMDLVAIAAADDQSATVTAAGGRQFHTTDGGTTWK